MWLVLALFVIVVLTVIVLPMRGLNTLGNTSEELSVKEEETMPLSIEDALDISEPIQTILTLLEQNPRDFKWVDGELHECDRVVHTPSDLYAILGCCSSITDQGYGRVYRHFYGIRIKGILLTLDEHNILYSAFGGYFESRQHKLTCLLEMRAARKSLKARSAVTDKLQQYIKGDIHEGT